MPIANDCRRILKGQKFEADPAGSMLMVERLNLPAVVQRRISDTWLVDEALYRLGQMVIRSPGLVTASFCLAKIEAPVEEQLTQKEFRYIPRAGKLTINMAPIQQNGEIIFPINLEHAIELMQEESSSGVLEPSQQERVEFRDVISNRAAEI